MSYNVVTNYQTTLSSSMSSTQNIVPVSSVITHDGHTLTMTDLGTIGFLVLEPGGTNEEIVSFTGISGSSFTGVTRGLAYYGKTISTVTSNQMAHQSGSKVIMSNVQYVYDQLVGLDGNQTIAGIKTFSSSPIVPTPISSAITSAASVEYVNNMAIAGAPNSSSTVKGISKLSIDPVSPTSPIAVGDNDTRVPTQNENDALVGTSGTAPSSTNKLVDNADTTGTGSVIRSSALGVFGDGSDGNVTETTRTLTKDMYYANLTVPNGVTLNTGNYRIFVSRTTTLTGTGAIVNNGNAGGTGGNGGGTSAAAGGTAGSAINAGSLPAGIAGLVGGIGGIYSNLPRGGGGGGGSGSSGGILALYSYSINISNSSSITALGGAGGAGGTGANGGGQSGGANGVSGGSGTAGIASSPSLGVSGVAYTTNGNGGAGGNASSGGYGAGAGGNGGAAGVATLTKSLPHSVANAQTLIETSTGTPLKSSASAGSGGGGGSAGTGTGGGYDGSGGGGGGGNGGSGGVIILLYHSLTNAGTISVAGGNGGSGGAAGTGAIINGTAGTAGSTGTTGIIYQIAI